MFGYDIDCVLSEFELERAKPRLWSRRIGEAEPVGGAQRGLRFGMA